MILKEAFFNIEGVFRWILGFLFITLVAGYFFAGWDQYLSLQFLESQRQFLIHHYRQSPALFTGTFFLFYCLYAAFFLPGSVVLTMASGAFFGFGTGFCLALLASTMAATGSFLISRYLLHDYIQNRFQEKLVTFNQGVRKQGAYYLLGLRLAPVAPFSLINLLMGLTPMRTFTYVSASFLGMLPGTAVYVFAGTQISSLAF